MPHYGDGTEAKVGDRVRFRTGRYDGPRYVHIMREGIVVEIHPTATTCDATVAFVRASGNPGFTLISTDVQVVTLAESEKAEIPVD
jgi:hypothetical protein